MKPVRLIAWVCAVNCSLLFAGWSAQPAAAQCNADGGGHMVSGHVSLLSDVPTCTYSVDRRQIAGTTIGVLPVGLFLRNPVVGTAAWMMSRPRNAAGTVDALARREGPIGALRGRRSPRQVAW